MNIPGWGFPALAAVFLGTSVYGLVGLSHERQQSEQMATANNELRASLSEVQKQLDEVSSQLNQRTKAEAVLPAPPPVAPVETAVAKQSPWGDDKIAADAVEQAESAEQPKAPVVKARPKPRVVARVHVPKDDPRWKEMQTKLSEQQEQLDNNAKAIDQARQDLEGKMNASHDELNGSIAKNHDELVTLEKQGQRNYYEFEIDKSKQFQKVGPMGVSLRKVNQKHKYYDLALMVDDQQLEKKHVNLYEPMMIRTADEPQAVELVVNEIHGNTIKGYVSEPKYRKNDLTASAAAPAAAATAPAPTIATTADAPKTLQQR